MDVLMAGIRHEIHSFVPGTLDLETFERGTLAEGAAMFDGVRGSELDGALRAASDRGIHPIPTLMASAGAGPAVEEACYARFSDAILRGVGQHRRRLDGIYLRLHGAMVTTERDDPEGDLIQDLRRIVGPDMPIAVSLDLHTHMTDRMIDGADILVGYRTCPHVDYVETGERTINLLADAIERRCHPVAVQRKIRLMTSSEAHDTDGGPLTEMQAWARRVEQEPGVLAVSIFATQPWMDVPDVGWSVTVIGDGDAAEAQRHADELATAVWDQRDRYNVDKTPIAEAVGAADALRDRSGPVVVSDGADSPSAGAGGDGTALLAYLDKRQTDLETLLIVTDPVAVHAAADAGVGATIDLNVGGRLTPEFFGQTPIRGEVIQVTDESYESVHPPAKIMPGLSSVLRVGLISVVIVEHKVPQKDLSPFTRLGLDPTTADLVQVKSAGGYRADYDPIAAAVFDLDTVGPCDSDLTRLPFQRITRPLWPFDPDLERPWW